MADLFIIGLLLWLIGTQYNMSGNEDHRNAGDGMISVAAIFLFILSLVFVFTWVSSIVVAVQKFFMYN